MVCIQETEVVPNNQALEGPRHLGVERRRLMTLRSYLEEGYLGGVGADPRILNLTELNDPL